MTSNEWLQTALAGEVVVAIGQLDKDATKLLKRAVKSGELHQWRGHWFPIAGASWGMGPLKSCYGTLAAKNALSAYGDFRPVGAA